MKKLLASVLSLAMTATMFVGAASADAGTVKIGMTGPLTGRRCRLRHLRCPLCTDCR